jgi:hypothetical protein
LDFVHQSADPHKLPGRRLKRRISRRLLKKDHESEVEEAPDETAPTEAGEGESQGADGEKKEDDKKYKTAMGAEKARKRKKAQSRWVSITNSLPPFCLIPSLLPLVLLP